MNTAHTVAWLTCLILAFFACILAVRNAGQTLKVEKELELMRERVTASEGGGLSGSDLRRIKQSLERIGQEVQALEGLEPAAEGEQFREHLRQLKERIQQLRGQLEQLRGAGEGDQPSS